MKRLLCLVALVGFLAGCDNRESRKVQLQQLGILGQHELRRIEKTNEISGNMTRNFFLGAGSMSSFEWKLQFCWGRTQDELIFTTLPYSRFRFIIDESKTVPTIEFLFDDYWLNQQRDAYTELEKSGMSEWLERVESEVLFGHDKVLTGVVIKISFEDLEREVYLPQR